MDTQNLGPIATVKISHMLFDKENRLFVATLQGKLLVYDIFQLAPEYDRDIKAGKFNEN